jgi:hypothetical protein
MRYSFEVIRRVAVKGGWCPICGKPVKRSRTFENTVNPFNRNELGAVRTHAEVVECVKQEAADWVPDFTHAKCASEVEGS